MPPGLTDRIYCDLNRYSKDGHLRGVLRVSLSCSWGAIAKLHIREWNSLARDESVLVPGRGIALTLEELDAVTFALHLVRDDVQNATIAVPDEQACRA
jgi:hypothetical protein